MDRTLRPSPLALAVLGLLAGGPLHPYGMQRLIKEWGKDQVINVGQRANLYKTIKRLHEAGLIEVLQTERAHQYPERTVYELTNSGRSLVLQWLAEMISTPRNEFPHFPAALSFAMLLGPDGVLTALEERAEELQKVIALKDGDLELGAAGLPRITMLEAEFQRAVTIAELGWVQGIIDELRAGTLQWSEADFAGAEESFFEE